MKVKRLKDLETHEVSLVDRPANQRTFLVLKNYNPLKGEKDMENNILSLLDTPLEKEEQYLETLKKSNMSDDATKALVGALRLIQPHLESISGEGTEVVKSLLGIEDQKAPATDVIEKSDDDLDINQIPEDVRDAVQGLFKSQSEAIQKAEELENEINIMKAEKLQKQYISKAEDDFSNVPGVTSKDLGLLLQEIAFAVPAAGEKFEAILQSVNKAMETSEVLEEAGQRTRHESGSAWDKVEAEAKSLRKSQPDLSIYQARAKVLEENTELFQAYNLEFESQKRS
jgi:hypothetical protein